MPRTFIVVDDHPAILEGTCHALQAEYPEAKILTANTADQVKPLLAANKPSLLMMDLGLPQSLGDPVRKETGLQMLSYLLNHHQQLNIVIQSVNPEGVAQFMERIQQHPAGFTIANKSLPSHEMLNKVSWALSHLIYIPTEMRTGLEVKEEWLTLIDLAFNQSLQDNRIAEEMNVSERTIRHYWTRVQNALGVYPSPGINIRIQTYSRAREAGLLD